MKGFIHYLRPWSGLLLVALSILSGPAHAAPGDADQALIARGEYLAKMGDCVACHSAPGGKPFAGGLPMTTPMGRIYSTNITPDADTGVGHYTQQDFNRAMRKGVAKDGRNLYPAMPYPSFSKVNDADLQALYAYIMHGVTPVRQPDRVSDIPWPMNMRWPLKFWNLVFLPGDVYRDKPGKDAAWNRGAYLVQGLGHCGACHTPRGIAFQEKAVDESGKAFVTGGALEGWFASNLSGDRNVGLGRWSEADLAAFLKIGANAHASAFGSMTEVINNSTQFVSDADSRAMSAYLKSLPAAGGNGAPPYAYDPVKTETLLRHPASVAGARLYTTYCLHCHGTDGRGYAPMYAPLAGNPNVLQSDTSSIINVTLNGTSDIVIQGIPAPYPMPKYESVLTDQDVADVLTFIRAGWNNGAPPIEARAVAKLRKQTDAAR